MTESDLSRAIGRLEGRFDAFERNRIERDEAVDRQLTAINGKRAGAWLVVRLPGWLR
jgi:hypothetical protein